MLLSPEKKKKKKVRDSQSEVVEALIRKGGKKITDPTEQMQIPQFSKPKSSFIQANRSYCFFISILQDQHL